MWCDSLLGQLTVADTGFPVDEGGKFQFNSTITWGNLENERNGYLTDITDICSHMSNLFVFSLFIPQHDFSFSEINLPNLPKNFQKAYFLHWAQNILNTDLIYSKMK